MLKSLLEASTVIAMVSLILTIVIDLVCIFTINMPIFVISEDYRIIRISDLDKYNISYIKYEKEVNND